MFNHRQGMGAALCWTHASEANKCRYTYSISKSAATETKTERCVGVIDTRPRDDIYADQA